MCNRLTIEDFIWSTVQVHVLLNTMEQDYKLQNVYQKNGFKINVPYMVPG